MRKEIMECRHFADIVNILNDNGYYLDYVSGIDYTPACIRIVSFYNGVSSTVMFIKFSDNCGTIEVINYDYIIGKYFGRSVY